MLFNGKFSITWFVFDLISKNKWPQNQYHLLVNDTILKFAHKNTRPIDKLTSVAVIEGFSSFSKSGEFGDLSEYENNKLRGNGCEHILSGPCKTAFANKLLYN